MPRVIERTKSTRGKDVHCGRCGKKIEPGEPYYRWAFRYGGKKYRCKDHYPQRSELTQSKLSTVFAAIESAEAEIPKAETVEDVSNLVNEVAEQSSEVASEYEEAAEHFGGEGENRERADQVEEFVQELEAFYPDDDSKIEDVREEAMSLLGECEL